MVAGNDEGRSGAKLLRAARDCPGATLCPNCPPSPGAYIFCQTKRHIQPNHLPAGGVHVVCLSDLSKGLAFCRQAKLLHAACDRRGDNLSARDLWGGVSFN